MSGIMAAVAGGAQNVIYAAGLYNTTYGVETSPVDFSASSSGGATLSYNYTWVGYYRPTATGTVTLGLAAVYAQYINYFGGTYQVNWGGSPSCVAYLWLGNTAKSGFTTGNANITANNTTATYSPSLVAGIYYPVRINLVMYLPYSPFAYFGAYPGWTDGGFNFQSNGSTDVNTLIWYNTKGPGF